jgi:creatinine amidohydrolase
VLVPEAVRAERIAEPRPTGRRDALTDPPSPRVDRPTWFKEWTENGALGDPRLASVELGEDIVETAYARALEFARRFAEEPLPEDEG